MDHHGFGKAMRELLNTYKKQGEGEGEGQNDEGHDDEGQGVGRS